MSGLNARKRGEAGYSTSTCVYLWGEGCHIHVFEFGMRVWYTKLAVTHSADITITGDLLEEHPSSVGYIVPDSYSATHSLSKVLMKSQCR